MADFLQSVGSAVRSVACGILSVQDSTVSFVGKISPTGLGPYPDIVRSLRRSVCGNNNGTVASPPDSFDNATTAPPSCGTTAGIAWWYTDNVNTYNTGWRFTAASFAATPVAVGNFRNNGTSTGLVDVTLSNGSVVVFTLTNFGRADGNWNASDFRLCLGTAGAPQPPSNNPQPPLPPYTPTPVTRSIDYDGPSGTVSENIDIVIFAPVVLAPLTIVSNILVTGNNFSLIGKLQLSPNFDIKLAPKFVIGGGGFGDVNANPGENQPPDEGKKDSARKIIGALIITTDAVGGRAGLIGQGDNPDIYYPRLGNVSFLIETDKGRGWTTDLPVRNTRQYVPCPAPQGAVDVRGTADVGYAFQVIAIYDSPTFSLSGGV